jgi:transposase, IS5 family
MRQKSFSSGFDKHHKQTRKERFLSEMDQVLPWKPLVNALDPYYPNPQGAGRRPIGLERMLRIYFMQHWYNLSDPAMEEALYDTPAMRAFAGIDLGDEPAPDESTILHFRHLMEAHDFGAELLRLVNEHLAEKGLKVARGTIVDATIINAPSSTKNQDGKRDPEMHSTQKHNQWYFGLKAHIGVDSDSKLVHSAAVTAANMHDSQALADLLHGDETRVWGDSAYTGQGEVLAEHAPNAQDFTHAKGCRNAPLTEADKRKNRTKSKVRAKVEHVFRVLKCQFGFTKVRYRGLDKNANHLFAAFALVNIVLAKRRLLRLSQA